MDIAYHLFCILKDNNFAIQNYRFGAFFTQLFPLISSRCGFSLNNIALSYSVSFTLLPLITFLIIHLGIKNSKVSVAYLLFVVLITTHTFYWIQSELPQALAFFFVLLALMENTVNKVKETSPYFWPIAGTVIFVVCFTHPLTFCPFLFAILYYYILYPNKRKIFYALSLFYGLLLTIKSLFFKTPYESQAMIGINNFKLLFPHYFNLQSHKNLIQYFIHDYYFALLLFIICLVYWFRQHQYKKILLLASFFIGYCFLINVTYPTGADQFYLENQYLILAFFVCLPFVFEILPSIKNSKIQFGILSVIFIISFLRIINTHKFYTNRLQWNRNLLTQTESLPNKKLILPVAKAPIDTLLMTWASSYEFWLLSTMEQGVSRSIIIEEKENEFNDALFANKSFVSQWGMFDYNTLNKKYFIFTDTTNYVRM